MRNDPGNRPGPRNGLQWRELTPRWPRSQGLTPSFSGGVEGCRPPKGLLQVSLCIWGSLALLGIGIPCPGWASPMTLYPS